MTLRVLVADSKVEDMLFLQDVFAELDGGSHWTTWTHVAASYAATWKEAAGMLRTYPVDVLMLDLDLSDSQGVDTFHRAQNAAPYVPVVLVLDRGGLPLGERLLREGAQDFLMREEMDCGPLARSLANAIGRHRLVAATRATSMIDPLTGLLNRTAFQLLADRDRMLAERLEQRLILVVARLSHAEAMGASQSDQRRDLEIVAAADYLRSLAGPTDLTARTGDTTLALVSMETPRQSAEDVWARLHSAARERRIEFGAAIFDPQRPVSLDALLARAVSDLPNRAMASTASANVTPFPSDRGTLS